MLTLKLNSLLKKIQAVWNSKKLQTGGVFLVFNVIFPSADLMTDCVAAVELGGTHFYWSALTIFWMFGPFTFSLLLYIINLFKMSGNYTNGLIKVFLHFPFILPLTNTILFIHLMMFDLTNSKNFGTIETIKRTAAVSGLYESYLESAPQMLTQINIILSTGQFQVSQQVQMIVHIFTFTLKACKAFYVQRKSSECDPDPSFKMTVVLFPLMLANVTNSAVQWTVLAGLLKPFVFIPVFMMFCLTWSLLTKMTQEENNSQDDVDKAKEKATEEKYGNSKEETDVSKRLSEFRRVSEVSEVYYKDTPFDRLIRGLGRVAEDANNDEGCFSVKASLTSVWVPCVVGSCNNTFLISALSALFTRSTFLVGAVLISSLEVYPDFLRKKSSLIFCNTDKKMKELLQDSSWKVNTCASLQDCFTTSTTMNDTIKVITQLHRVCGDDEDIPFKMGMMAILLLLYLSSLVSIYFLHQFTSYRTLFEISKKYFKYFSISPIIHRSLIFQVIQTRNHGKLEELSDIIKRATDNGETPAGESKEDHVVGEEGSQHDDEDVLSKKSSNGESKEHHVVMEEDNQLETEDELADCRCSQGCSPLHLPVFIKNQFSKNTSNGESKEHHVVMEEDNQLETEDELSVETMLDRQCPQGWSPLHLAVLLKDATSVGILLESGAKVEQDSTPKHPLTSAFTSDLTCFEMMIKYTNKTQTKKAFQQAMESNNIPYVHRLLQHRENSIPFRSNIILGPLNHYATVEKFNTIGDGNKTVRSIRVNFNSVGWMAGLEMVWSDGIREVLGLAEDHESVCESVQVDAPEDANFSCVRGKTEDHFIVALAFDTVTSSGIVKHGEWVRSSAANVEGKGTKDGTDNREVIDTMSMFDIENSLVMGVLDGFKGHLDNYLVPGSFTDGDYESRLFLNNLSVTYRISFIPKEN